MKIGKVIAVTLISGTAYAGAAQAVPTVMDLGATSTNILKAYGWGSSGSYSTYGNTTYGSYGSGGSSTHQQYGNQTYSYYSSGRSQTCSTYGNQTYCN